MRILLCSSHWHERGGDTTLLFLEAEAMRARGHEVVPFSTRHPDNLRSPWEARWPSMVDARGARGLRRISQFASAVHNRDAASAIASLADHVRPDVAHLHHVHRHLTPSIVGALRSRRVPVLWTLHDYELVCPAGTLYTHDGPCRRCVGGAPWPAIEHRCKRGGWADSVAVAVEHAVHARLGVTRQVDRFLCPSRFMLERMAEGGISRERMTHLPNAVEVDAAAGAGGGSGVLFAGRLDRDKGADRVLALARATPAVPFTMLGDGACLAEARSLANVRAPGRVTRAEVRAATREAAVVVVPSRWPENCPYAVLEAQASARAVVASAVGGIPELVEDGVDGRLVADVEGGGLAEVVAEVLGDPAQRERLGRNAQARVAEKNDVSAWAATVERIAGGL